jgi:hypothetical protein
MVRVRVRAPPMGCSLPNVSSGSPRAVLGLGFGLGSGLCLGLGFSQIVSSCCVATRAGGQRGEARAGRTVHTTGSYKAGGGPEAKRLGGGSLRLHSHTSKLQDWGVDPSRLGGWTPPAQPPYYRASPLRIHTRRGGVLPASLWGWVPSDSLSTSGFIVHIRIHCLPPDSLSPSGVTIVRTTTGWKTGGINLNHNPNPNPLASPRCA